MRVFHASSLLLIGFGCLLNLHAVEPPGAADLEFFEKKVRPVLVERCYECHGEEKQKGGLRLDSREGMLKGGDTGPAIVPGKPAESLLIKGISYQDPDFQMPPKNPLSEAEVETLRVWIARGAPDPRVGPITAAKEKQEIPGKDFWSYQPPRKSVAPGVKANQWPRGEIDRYILAGIEGEGLHLAEDAEPAVLLRRVYFDLIGLPPTPEEIREFETNPSAEAFEKVVDRLLGSPQFGERWARHWLDVARFAESVTLRGFVFEHAWRYRDYVIEAFNRDLPFDQFIREQIAGDLLEAESLEEKQRGRIATTFLVLGNINYEEQDKAQLRMDIVDEQLDTIGKAFLAQTIGCARCHDHKFDPIPTRDYYAMAGILRNTKSVEHANVSNWLEVPLPLPAQEEARFAEQERAVARLQEQIKEAKAELGKLSGGNSAPGPIDPKKLPGIVVDDAQAKKVGDWQHSTYSGKFVGMGYLHDRAEGKGAKTLTFLPELEHSGKYEVRLAYVPSDNRAANVPVTILHAGGETVVRVDQRKVPPIEERLVVLGQFEFEKGNQGYVLISNEGTQQHVIADAVQFIPVAELNQLAEAKPVGDNENEAERAHLAAKIKQLEGELKESTAKQPKRPMAMSVREEKEISETHVHIRGSVHSLGEKVARGFLEVATYGEPPGIPAEQSGRKELAEWIASANNPLTARVIANRVWHWLLGNGIVRTPDNFGTTGARPSHPELLDYLALRLIEEKWSLKSLIREIVLSRTYQLGSEGSPGLTAADPENRFFARAERERLGPEALRDTMLLLSGQLDLRGNGPNYPPGTKADYGYLDKSLRRSVYVPVFRNALPEIFELFDFADPSMVTGQRNESTIAPQALFFLNHPFVLEQAGLAAKRILSRAGSDEARLQEFYLAALGRTPTARESALARDFLAEAGANEFGPEQAWAELCQAVFASMDFRHVD